MVNRLLGKSLFGLLAACAFAPLAQAVADQKAAWKVFDAWDKPFLCAFSDGDPITRTGETRFIGRVPGTAGQPHRTLKGGHFIQEDDPQGFVAAILDVAAKGAPQ